VQAPEGFRKWRFYWFECPACRQARSRAYANASLGQNPARVRWRFWCEDCGTYSTFERPIVPALNALFLLLVVGPLGFLFLYRTFLGGLTVTSVLAAVVTVAVIYPLIFFMLTRWTHRYVRVVP
jgi:hypothetical protein